MISLHLRNRATLDDGYESSLTAYAHTWRRTTRALGGYWMGDFKIAADRASVDEMAQFFARNLGKRVRELTYSIISWEGEITKLEFTVGGITYERTLTPERWHNKVKVSYTDAATSVAAATGWSENTDSSDVYGESCFIDVVGDNYDSTMADALRDRRITENAHPRTRSSRDLEKRSGSGLRTPPELRVYCAGYVFSMNRRYRESDTAAAALSTQVSALVGESEFVTTGFIETNADTAVISGSEVPFRLWDGIEDLIQMGDSSGNRWVGGVYNGRKFTYKQAETLVTHRWINGELMDIAGTPIIPSLLKPDTIVDIRDAPIGIVPPGGNVWDGPRRIYVEEVEFIAPDGYRLIPTDEVAF
jgi:hypothetical protein